MGINALLFWFPGPCENTRLGHWTLTAWLLDCTIVVFFTNFVFFQKKLHAFQGTGSRMISNKKQSRSQGLWKNKRPQFHDGNATTTQNLIKLERIKNSHSIYSRKTLYPFHCNDNKSIYSNKWSNLHTSIWPSRRHCVASSSLVKMLLRINERRTSPFFSN